LDEVTNLTKPWIPLIIVEKHVEICNSAYDACAGAAALVICTEWDEFKMAHLDYQKIYDSMQKPAFIFDGRLILDAPKLREIGFRVETIGKSV